MRAAPYPFTAIVGQSEMKLALLLAAVDWKLSVLLRGDKGSGKTTAARALAALLPGASPFINLPLGATEDRLLGGLHLERTLKGDPVLKPGLLAEAHGGVLYVDEVNLLPAHLGDALLDAAATGVHMVEREGLSATSPAEFVLLGSMNPEEGSLRPQLLDRFALSVMVSAPFDSAERQKIIEGRIAFERDPEQFQDGWAAAQQDLRSQIASARACLSKVSCSSEMMESISVAVCENNVQSLRADLAAFRAALAYAALSGEVCVESRHVEAVLPLVLAHRFRDSRPSSSTPPTPPTQRNRTEPGATPETGVQSSPELIQERIFTPAAVVSPALELRLRAPANGTGSAPADGGERGPVTGNRRKETPADLDLHATLVHSLRETGGMRPRIEDLHERVRKPRSGTRYLFVIDSSGSHAAQQRMREVKGAVAALLTSSFKRGDEVAIIVFRGTSANLVLAPTHLLPDALTSLEYLPTGGRTPLAAGLDQAREYVTPATLLIVLTDGRANIALHGGDPWQEALDLAQRLDCKSILVDTEPAAQSLGRCQDLAKALQAQYVTLEEFTHRRDLLQEIQPAQPVGQGA
ncbi:MAG TPA: ATP-binding protein [Acidobacteriaceae bacterium]|nr:ATP-binding protein [Acidobacteriaceae bacterium]